ncbi:MAG: AAA family ATPase [Planctomycetes bacterium]|nr:AAA family ATPase [Planctomycetota bacterium]
MHEFSEQLETTHTASLGIPRGFRLQRLEVFNWGTFDSTSGNVHVIPVQGQTTLLVGHNGSGKSTLVDALLTLLVRPGNSRNYNVAAGAGKGERNERSYIRGAYDRRSDEDSRSEVQYLRKGPGHYSVLLACFRNEATGGVFTLAMVLHLAADNSVEKLYCFAPEERSIAAHCSGLRSMDKLAKQMQERGFPKTTKSYAEYFEWFRKATGIQPQALDMFNQTVAVKDIQRLNDFLRKHMLEAKPWGEKVDELLRHFQDLSDAHRDLLRVQRQFTLLQPIAEQGTVYRAQAGELQRVERLLQATDAFFYQKVIDLFTPVCAERKQELVRTVTRRQATVVEIDAAREQCRQLQNEIDQAGGERLRQIPFLIAAHDAAAAGKRNQSQSFHDALQRAGLTDSVADEAAFQTVRSRFAGMTGQWQAELAAAEQQRRALIHRHGEAIRMLRDEETELQAVLQRQGNIPARLGDVRRDLCAELRLKEQELPFVAELVSVKAADREWEPSLEMILRNFALTLLVPDHCYALVSGYLERTRLRDAQGHGQRLVYQHVGKSTAKPTELSPDVRSLPQKLEFRPNHPLVPWVKGELLERFGFRCCDTLAEFQAAPGKALTRERHVKFPGGRHEKNDRDEAVDPRRYVLGWDHREKQRRLQDGIQELRQQLGRLDAQIQRFDDDQTQLRRRLQAVEEASRVTEFAALDYWSEERESTTLRLEKQALEENNHAVRLLKQRQAEREQQIAALELRREQLIREMERCEREIQNGERLIAHARQYVQRGNGDGTFPRLAECFAELEAYFTDAPLTWEDLLPRKETFLQARRAEQVGLKDRLQPIEEQLRKAMAQYLRAFADDKLELDPDIKYLEDFLALFQRICAEELPKHEQRFKERLNEKVGDEVSLLRGALQRERGEIEERIELLNKSLRQLEYRPGTHMRLQAKPVRDREVVEFRQALDECVSGSFDGTPEANEQRYLRIEKLIVRLRDEEAWRRKVTDVRNWFDFAAVETDDLTGAERSYHEDSCGQSGGEKAKLAFTILVAAIAYQYDLQPGTAGQSRFHFVVVDEMFSRIDDRYSRYALDLFAKFELQLLIVAPLDAKARVTEPYVGCYLHVAKDAQTNRSEVFCMNAREFQENMATADGVESPARVAPKRPRNAPK